MGQVSSGTCLPEERRRGGRRWNQNTGFSTCSSSSQLPVRISTLMHGLLTHLGKGAQKKEKKLTNVSFMYVCVAENCEMLVCFLFSPTIVRIDNYLSESRF